VSTIAAAARPESHRRFPHVDALRALAALSVLVFHVESIGPHYNLTVAGPHTLLGRFALQMSNGVCVFFVISGFVLYRPFVAARSERAAGPALRSYLRRRFLRIVPAYWLALTVLTIAFSLPFVFSHDWWRYYGLLQVYEAHSATGGMRVAWTLCIEVTFYLFLPVYAYLVGRFATKMRRELLVLGGLAGLTWGWRLLATHHVLGAYLLDTLPGNLDWFVLGMTLAVLSVRRVQISTRAALASCLLTLPLMVLFPRALPNHLMAGLFAVSVVSVAVLTPSPPRLLLWRPLAWLGVISYGIYLWHATLIPPVIHHIHFVNFATVTLATTLAAVAAAALSYYVVERRVLDWGERRAAARKPAIVPAPVAAREGTPALEQVGG
jgi:peptidoglycan/LPS O-acetylase OafA/YrhL